MISVMTSMLTRALCFSLLLITTLAQATIQKSPNDNREYLSFTLPNQMKVLVISDSDTDKAAASLDLNVGSNANPEDRLGLAHFLEHMLFLGTEKYPEAGSYQAFISQNGGNHNAYTAYENTNYFFDVRADQLEPALDRFSRFFIDPLFTEQYVDRERHAVNSEYQSKLRDDGRRGHSATKMVMNPEHPYSRFAVGSLDTLSNNNGDLRQDLIRFYDEYYSANLMTLVILGKQSTAELKAMAESKFSAVINRNATISTPAIPVFQDLPLQLNIQTVKDLKQLKLTFPIPAVRHLYHKKPAHYIATMLGYEGKGSLFSVLKAKGWANGLGAYNGLDLPDQSSITLSIALTDNGYEHYNDVIATTFAAIRLLQSQGITEPLYQEEAQISALRFRFKESSQPIHYVAMLARNLQYFPTELVISANYLMDDYDPELIDSILSHMTPDNVLVTRQSQAVATDKQEPWFNAGYSVEPITEAQRAQWQDASIPEGLATRLTNPFIAEDVTLKSRRDVTDKPSLVLKSEGRSLWYKHDTEFGVPKADFWFTVITDQVRKSATHAAMTELFTDLLKDNLNETLYDASQAGLNTRIYTHAQGFTVRISGYNDKQSVLLQTVLNQLQTVQISEENFDRIKTLYIQELENSLKDKPYNQTIGEIYTLLMQNWSTREKLEALPAITLEQLENFVPQLLADTEIRMLANGNLTEAEAIAMADQVINSLPENPTFRGRKSLPVVQLEPAKHLTQTLPIQHNDSAISVYFQGPDSEIHTRAAYALLSEALSAPFYSKLRTEQQLGYVVFESPLPIRKAPGLVFVVQSPNTDPVSIEKHIDRFMTDMSEQLQQMEPDELNSLKASILSRVNQKETRLSERTGRYWQEIDRNESEFDTREQLSAAIESLTLEDVLNTYDQLPLRRLIVRSFGEQHHKNAAAEELARVSGSQIRELKDKGQFVPGA